MIYECYVTQWSIMKAEQIMFLDGAVMINLKTTLLMCSYCPLRLVLHEPVCNRSVLSIIYLMTPAGQHCHVRARRAAGLPPVNTAGRCSDISLRRQMKPPIVEVTINK